MSAAGVRPLRQAVLRPGEPAWTVEYEGDDDPGTAHFALISGGAAVSVASVMRRPPAQRGWGATWCLRGVATDAALQGRGCGGGLLRAVIEDLAAEGGGLLWCNARVGAVDFYRRMGFVDAGEPEFAAWCGSHRLMCRAIAAESSCHSPATGVWSGRSGDILSLPH